MNLSANSDNPHNRSACCNSWTYLTCIHNEVFSFLIVILNGSSSENLHQRITSGLKLFCINIDSSSLIGQTSFSLNVNIFVKGEFVKGKMVPIDSSTLKLKDTTIMWLPRQLTMSPNCSSEVFMLFLPFNFYCRNIISPISYC